MKPKPKLTLMRSGSLTAKGKYYRIMKIQDAVTVVEPKTGNPLRAGDSITEEIAEALMERATLTILAPKE